MIDIVVALSLLQSPMPTTRAIARVPRFGRVGSDAFPDMVGAPSAVSIDGRYLLARVNDLSVGCCYSIYPSLVSIDTITGESHPIDLTPQGFAPAPLGGIFDEHRIVATTPDLRFVIISSPAMNYTGHTTSPVYASLYWLDRDTDADGIYDEPLARRIVLLDPSIPATSAGVSNDGRYVVYTANAQYGFPHPTCRPIVLADLDADGDGILGEPSDLKEHVVSAPITSTPNGLDCGNPSISGDGRYVAYAAEDATYSYGYSPHGGGHFLVDWADDYPFAGRVDLIDRDPDGNHVFDEPGATSTLFISRALGGLVASDSTTLPIAVHLANDGSRVLFSHRGEWGQHGIFTGAATPIIESYEIATHQVVRVAPQPAGPCSEPDVSDAFGGFPGMLDFAIDATGRRVVFATQCTPTSTTPVTHRGPQSIAIVDRDPDQNGILDEPGSTHVSFPLAAEFETAQLLSVANAFLRGDALFALDVGPFDAGGNDFGTYRVDLDCGASIETGGQCPTLAGWLDLYGCPAPGSRVYLELTSKPTSQSIAFLCASQSKGTIPLSKGCPLTIGSPIAVAPIVLQPSPGGYHRAAIPMQVPPQMPWSSLYLQAVFSMNNGKHVPSRRLFIRIQ